MNKLYHLVTNKIKIKDQCNDAIAYFPKFNDKFSLSRYFVIYPLPVVTVTLIRGKKNRSYVISVLKCLWDRGDTNSMIKRKQTIPYECRICYNKVEYITEEGPYFTTHNAKVKFVCQSFLAVRSFCTAFMLITMKVIQE